MTRSIMNEDAAVVFRREVEAALEAAKKVLETSRNPVYPSECPHSYSDKYLLAEIATRTASASVADALDASLPGWGQHFEQMQHWVYKERKTVTLRHTGTMTCDFVRTTERRVEAATSVTRKTGLMNVATKKETTTVTTKIIEHVWKVRTNWEVSAYAGADHTKAVVVLASGADGEVELLTRGDDRVENQGKPVPPRPEVQALDTVETDLTWLLSVLPVVQTAKVEQEKEGTPQFIIDRTATSCRTPRRNQDMKAALKAFFGIQKFVKEVASKNFLSEIFGVVENHKNVDTNSFRTSHQSTFSPVLAMFALEESTEATTNPTLSHRDMDSFLIEHRRSVRETMTRLAEMCPSDATASLIDPLAVGIVTTFLHISNLCRHLVDAIDALEAGLRSQLMAAIGKEVKPQDFAEYMDFHNLRIFRKEHEPERFCYAVRRDGRYPDGTLSLEPAHGEAGALPLLTAVSKQDAVRPMKVALSTSSELSLMGKRFVHAAVLHSFSGNNHNNNLNLVARARQFSSFVLLAGRITAADRFEPTAAVVVKDKDDLSIPLMLETIPTPKEFRDAIESLSPEQQRFARAYRSLQLSSTLFGVGIVQIKPQLEKVLNLPEGALTKEIQLTQDLMDMFIKYQVSSDLLSFDGPLEESQAEKLGAVKNHVEQIKKVIQTQRDAELKTAAEEKAKALFERMDEDTMYDDDDSGEEFNESLCTVPMVSLRSAGYSPPGGSCAPLNARKSYKAKSSSTAPSSRSFSFKKARGGNTAYTGQSPFHYASGVVQPASGVVQPQQQRQRHDSVQSSSSKGGTTAHRSQSPQQHQLQRHDNDNNEDEQLDDEIDYTKLPAVLDKKFEELDTDSALRPTIINIGPTWTRKSQAGLLSKPVEMILRESQQKDEKNKAFDLLDALTRSGVLPVAEASIHVVLAATHCFDKTVTNAVIMDNVNPIEKVERSVLIATSAITGKTAAELIKPDQLERITLNSPMIAASDEALL